MKRLTIGFIGIADFRHILGQQVIDGVQRACRDLDLELINFGGAIKYSIASDSAYMDHYRHNFAYCHKSNIDGLVSWASSLQEFVSAQEIVDLHKTVDVPIVAIGAEVLPDVSGVYTDPREGLTLVIRHLVEHHGMRKVAFLGANYRPHHANRLSVYRRCLAELGIPADETLVMLVPSDERPDVRQALDDLLDKRQKNPGGDVEAIVTTNDMHAQFVIEDLAQRGIRVPEDLVVTGYNNQLPAISALTPVTSVDFAVDQKAYQAVQLLVDQIKAGQKLSPARTEPKQHFWPARLIIRQSCNCYEPAIGASSQRDSDPAPESPRPSTKTEAIPDAVRQVFAEAYGEAIVSRAIYALGQALFERDDREFLRIIRESSLGLDPTSLPDSPINRVLAKLRLRLYEHFGASHPLIPEIEDLLHRARSMIETMHSYHMKLSQANVYQFMALAHIALDFSRVESASQVVEVLRNNLPDLGIPGLHLLLSDEPGRTASNGRIVFSRRSGQQAPFPAEEIVRVAYGRLPPIAVRSGDERKSFMFEVLHFQNRHYGYLLIEMGPENVPLYDTIRVLVGNGVVVGYKRDPDELVSSERNALLQSAQVRTIWETVTISPENQHELDAKTLVDFLIDRIQEPTELERFAQELRISRSNLSRKSQQLTGHSIQQLHELLKIERAKLLIDRNYLKIGEVADRLGYQSQFYFSRVFHKHVGLSPRAWMNRPR